MARTHPLGDICTFTAHGLLKTMVAAGGLDHRSTIQRGPFRQVQAGGPGRAAAASAVTKSVFC